MRTGTRGHDDFRLSWLGILVRSRAARGLLALALVAAASRPEVVGHSIADLVIAPADARKGLRSFSHDRRRFRMPPALPLPPPTAALPQLPRAAAFPPSPGARAFVPLPRLGAMPPTFNRRDAALPAPTPRAGWRPSRRREGFGDDRARPDAGGALRPQVRHDRGHPGGWETHTRSVPVGGDRVEAVRGLADWPARSAAPQAAGPPRGPGRRHASFRQHLEKLTQRRRRRQQAATPAAPVRQAARAVRTTRPARLGGRLVGEMLPQVGTFRPDEVLAVNLSADGLARARASEYGVAGTTELPELGLTITHLTPPANLNVVSAREHLFELLPEEGFTLNRVYSPYRPGAGRPGGTGSIPVAQDAAGCPSERCFGGALIKWQPRLAACGRDIRIGIIDTGFDKGHPAFTSVRYDYREFLPAGRLKASAQHGTGVLSLLAGGAGSGTPGLLPDAAYLIANAFFADADGEPVSDTAHMVRALNWLKRSGAAVVNLSFAGPEDALVHHAVRELTRSGTVIVAAAGNEGPAAPPSYPAAYEEVIAVTAVDRNLAAYRYANRGAHIDLAAPGVEVWTAMPGRREGPQTGTSFAVPFVTAVVAVAMAESQLAVVDSDPLAPKRHALAQLRSRVKGLGSQGRDATFGEGLVQAPASCAPAASVVAANADDVPAQPWASTVRRVLDTVGTEPLVMGSWISTVRAATGEGITR